jgi:hypothetical protein
MDSSEHALATRRSWEPPLLKTIGTIGEVLRGGGGKLSTNAGDTGEPVRKPKGNPG